MSTTTGTTPLYDCATETNSATVHNYTNDEGGFRDTGGSSHDGRETSNSGGTTPSIPEPSPRGTVGRSPAANTCDVELRVRSPERITSSLGRDNREFPRPLLEWGSPDNLTFLCRCDDPARRFMFLDTP